MIPNPAINIEANVFINKCIVKSENLEFLKNSIDSMLNALNVVKLPKNPTIINNLNSKLEL